MCVNHGVEQAVVSTEHQPRQLEDHKIQNNPHQPILLIRAVSYKEYFRQIFGLSGSKIFVESIPRKYYLGKMGSVLRF